MAVKKSSKKAASKTKATVAVSRKTPAIQKKYTKTEILNEIAENTSVSKKEVAGDTGSADHHGPGNVVAGGTVAWHDPTS